VTQELCSVITIPKENALRKTFRGAYGEGRFAVGAHLMERQGVETSFAATSIEYRDGVFAAREKIAIHQ
jgi:hypothetical protein